MSLDMHSPSDTTAPRSHGTRVVITGSCEGLAELRDALAEHTDFELPGWCTDVRDAAGMLASDAPTVVLHAIRGPSVPTTDLLRIREYTQAPIILLTSGEHSHLFEQALEVGVADVLVLPQPAERVVFAVQKAQTTGHRAIDLAAGGPSRAGRIVTVLGPKGGTGKSLIATNLAAALAKHHGMRTLLVDLDLQFGDVALMLGSEPEKTIYDLVVSPGELDADKLGGYTLHHPSGLDLLPAPLRPEDAELVTEEKVAAVLTLARELYDVVVVDTSSFLHGTTLAALDSTDELLVLCSFDVSTLKNVRLTLRTLELLSFPRERVELVLNQFTPSRAMKRNELEAALEGKVRFEVPYDSDVPTAVSRGEPPVLNGRAGFSRAVRDIAFALASPTNKRSRWLALRRP